MKAWSYNPFQYVHTLFLDLTILGNRLHVLSEFRITSLLFLKLLLEVKALLELCGLLLAVIYHLLVLGSFIRVGELLVLLLDALCVFLDLYLLGNRRLQVMIPLHQLVRMRELKDEVSEMSRQDDPREIFRLLNNHEAALERHYIHDVGEFPVTSD